MPMSYPHVSIPDAEIPAAAHPAYQHVLDIYAGETNKVASTWLEFTAGDLDYRPTPKATSVRGILEHQLLSERRFFGEFLGTPEPPGAGVLPADASPRGFADRLVALARPRLDELAGKDEAWWLETVPFFDVERSRIWVFWRRVLHTAHHRTQLVVYLRLLDRIVQPTYGPTADVTWSGADPTLTVAAADRRTPPSNPSSGSQANT